MRGTLLNSVEAQYSLGDTESIPNLSDGRVHQVVIQYSGSALAVRMDGSTRLVVPVDLQSRLPLPASGAFVGFTAGSGTSYENHDVLGCYYQPYGVQDVLSRGSADDLRLSSFSNGSWHQSVIGGMASVIDSSPSAFDDPVTGNVYVFAQGPGHVLTEDWSTAGTWHHGTVAATNGTIFGRPLSLLDPATSDQYVYAQGPGNTLTEDWWGAAGQVWHREAIPGTHGTVFGAPAALSPGD